MRTKIILVAGLLVIAASFPSPAQTVRGTGNAVRVLPDLKVSLVSAKGTKAVARVQNMCKGDAPATKLIMFVYMGADKSSGQDSTLTKVAEVPPLVGANSTTMGKNTADIVITLPPDKTVDGKFIRVEVDRFNAVKESSEGNNWHETGVGASQPFPEKSGYCSGAANDFPPPSFKLTAVNESGGGTTYTFSVSGWESVPWTWFSENPPTTAQCGNTLYAARMIARLYRVGGSGGAQDAGCTAFHKNDLGKISLKVPGLASDTAQVRLVLEDRLFKVKYSSPLFDVEPFTLLKGLGALGCQTLLNNPNSFVCSTDSGFKSCEDIRKSGKPIKCLRAAKTQ